MNPTNPSSWQPIVTALTIWFVHFMTCWAASELIWPDQWPAHAAAGTATLVAWGALARQFRGLRAMQCGGEVSCWKRRFAWRATALATMAVLFNALPALLLLP